MPSRAEFYDSPGETNGRYSVWADHGATLLSGPFYVWPSGEGGRLGSRVPMPFPGKPSSHLAWPILAKIIPSNDLRTVPTRHSAAGPGWWLHKWRFLVPLHPSGG